jgi:hypothetical protein
VAPLPYHDDVYGGRQNTLADGFALWAGAGRSAAEYKQAARFVSFMLAPDMQVESGQRLRRPADDGGGACRGAQQVTEGRAGRPLRLPTVRSRASAPHNRRMSPTSIRCASSPTRNWNRSGPTRSSGQGGARHRGQSWQRGAGGQAGAEKVAAVLMPLPLPRWIAHRGGGRLAPENTLAGIRMAARLGFKAVEFDVMLNGDGTPVLIHDETLERTTNGAGRVCDTPDSVLFSLDAGHGERIPRFAEAAALCRELGLLANVEIKPAAGHELATAAVVSRQTADLWRGAAFQPLLSSFSLAALEVARDVAPEIQPWRAVRSPASPTGGRKCSGCARFPCIVTPICCATRSWPRRGRMTFQSCVTRSTRRNRQKCFFPAASVACSPIASIFLPDSSGAGCKGGRVFF